MNILSREQLKKVREKFPIGQRVSLIRMNDVQAPPAGTQGTVRDVDDMGTVHVSWDNGSSLGVVYLEDCCKTI